MKFTVEVLNFIYTAVTKPAGFLYGMIIPAILGLLQSYFVVILFG
jgi:hypothetical protein